MTSQPDKTIHEDLALTTAAAFSASIDESLRGDPGEPSFDDATLSDAAESVWTWRRVAIATAIVAAATGELIWALSARDSLEARRRETEALPESEKAGLEARRERFEKLDAAEQERLRRLQVEMSNDGDPASLDATLKKYLEWKSQLPPQESALLTGLDPTKRTEQVTTLVDKQFSEYDSKKLVMWLENEVRKHQAKILATLPTQTRERFEAMGERERSFALMYHLLSTRGGGARMDDIAGDLPKLRAMLSPSAQARWDAAAKNKDEFRSLLTDWIRQSFERGMMHRDAGKSFLAINEKELQRFFEAEISETDRKRLMALPKEDMMSQLRREYFRSKGYWKDPSGKPIGFGGRGPFGPMHDDGRGGMYRRQPDDGRPPSEGPGGERRPPNGEPPPPPPPRPGATDARGGPPRSDRDKRFGPGGPFNSDGKPTFENGPGFGLDGPSRRDRRPDPDSKPFVPEA